MKFQNKCQTKKSNNKLKCVQRAGRKHKGVKKVRQKTVEESIEARVNWGAT